MVPPLKDSIVSTYAFPREESKIYILLDPTDADDVELLAFDEEGKAISAPDNTDWENLRVELTVERLKLNEHGPLPEARRKVWQRMSREIDLYQWHKSQ